jgi:hypothetical protein
MGNLLKQINKINESVEFINQSIDTIINEQNTLDKLKSLQSDIESRASKFTGRGTGSYDNSKNSVAQQIYDGGYKKITINFSSEISVIKDSSGNTKKISNGEKTFDIKSYGGGDTIKVKSDRVYYLISFKHKKENTRNGGELSIYNESDSTNYPPTDWAGSITNFKK